MKARSVAAKAWLLAVILLLAGTAQAGEIKVLLSSGFAAACHELAQEFERKTGNKVVLVLGPSMGSTPQAIPNRLERGEPADVIIMVGYSLADLAKKGHVLADSRVDLAQSGIGMAVRAGTPKPDIASAEAFKKTLLAAKSIAYSDSASGVYIQNELFPKMGIVEDVRSKSRMIPAEPVAQVVARGEAEIGFQQISELLPIAGIEVVGPLPPGLQKMTVFSAGVATSSKQPQVAKQFIEFLASPAGAPVISKTGMEPLVGRK